MAGPFRCYGRPLIIRAAVIGLLERGDRLLIGFGVITDLADRAFPSTELLG
jgi:hypothetical protein